MRQKRAHSSSSNIQLDEAAAKSDQAASQNPSGSSVGAAVAAAAATRVHALGKHGYRPKSLKKDGPPSDSPKSPSVDPEAQKNINVWVFVFQSRGEALLTFE